MCIKGVLPNKSLDVVYLALSFIQKWRVLMQSSEKTLVESMIKKMRKPGVSGHRMWSCLMLDIFDKGVCDEGGYQATCYQIVHLVNILLNNVLTLIESSLRL
jgi:hypothetical protein